MVEIFIYRCDRSAGYVFVASDFILSLVQTFPEIKYFPEQENRYKKTTIYDEKNRTIARRKDRTDADIVSLEINR